MNIPPTDDELARAHDAFRRNHDAGRQRLLEMLSLESPNILTEGRFSMRRVFRELTSDWSLRSPGHLIGKLALAATVLVAIALGFYAWFGERRVYALDDLPQRLMEIKSIYMTGWSLEADHKQHPFTLFAERPNCYWHPKYSVSDPDATREHSYVRSAYVACNGRECLYVSNDDKKVIVENVPPIASELETEGIFQHRVLPSLLDGSHGDFVKTGSEMVGDTRCDVYEGRWVFKTRVWFNPKSGLPVRIAYYGTRDGEDKIRAMVDHIEVNVSASEKTLSFAPPEGYRVTRTIEEVNPLKHFGSSSGSFGKLTTGCYLNIGGKAVLVCWACDVRSGDKTSHGEVTFVLGQDRECDNIKMAAIEADGRQWNWSLVFPKKKGEHIGSDGLKVIPPWSKNRTSGVQHTPLRFPEDRLRSAIEEIQLATKTVSAGAKPFTLEMLRAKIAGLTAAGS